VTTLDRPPERARSRLRSPVVRSSEFVRCLLGFDRLALRLPRSFRVFRITKFPRDHSQCAGIGPWSARAGSRLRSWSVATPPHRTDCCRLIRRREGAQGAASRVRSPGAFYLCSLSCGYGCPLTPYRRRITIGRQSGGGVLAPSPVMSSWTRGCPSAQTIGGEAVRSVFRIMVGSALRTVVRRYAPRWWIWIGLAA
jgi:hypothetical protein